MSSPIFRPILVFGAAATLFSLAGAQESPFSAPDPVSRPISQREWVEAASGQISLLSSLRGWRETLRARGSAPRRDFRPLGQSFALSLGNVAPPLLGSGAGAGVAARWKMLEIGTTAQPQPVGDALTYFDELMTGENAAKTRNPTQISWLRVRPIQNKAAELEFSVGHARRDFQGATGQSARDLGFENARGRLNLPANWSLRGDLTRAKPENSAQSAHSYEIEAAGPIVHPFGVAQARADWRDVGAGYADLGIAAENIAPEAETLATGQKTGTVEVAQDVAIGPLAGNIKVAANQRQREAAPATARIGDEVGATGAQSQAQMRLALTPNLGLWSQAALQVENATRFGQISASPDPISADSTSPDAISTGEVDSNDALPSPSQERLYLQQGSADVGAQWKFSRALSVSVSTGASRTQTQREIGQTWLDAPQSEENRRSIELRRQGRAADFRVRLSQRTRRGMESGAPSAPTQISQWRIEAARHLIGSVRLKTIVDVARDTQNALEARRYEAQLQFAHAARFDARYRQGTLPQGLLPDDWNSALAASDTSPSQWSARFNAGSTATGAGFGLALEYARSVGANPDSWRVGVQFK